MTLTEFEALASEKLSENNEKTRNDFLHLLNAGLLQIVIRSLIDNQINLYEVANRSYYHKNGFLKVLLVDKRPKYSIRLHIWPDQPLKEGDIHNHPWDISVLVLNGAYEWLDYNIEYIQEENEQFNLYKCHYLKDYSGHSFFKKRSVKVFKINETNIGKGNLLNLSSEKYHSVKKDNNKPAESIIITSNSEKLSANVITNRKIDCDDMFYNSSIESSFLKEKLLFIMNRSQH